MASVDKLLEERFRHIMQDEKWIPQTISALVGGEVPTSTTPATSSCDTRKLLGGSLVIGALLGLAIVWYKKE